MASVEEREGPAPQLDRAVGRWMARVAEAPGLVVLLCVALTSVLGLVAARDLRINADLNAMVSAGAPFRQREIALQRAFPTGIDSILVFVESDEPGRARTAARALVERLEQHSDLFMSVSAPGAEPFFERNGLLYLSLDEIGGLTDELARTQPFLAALSGKDAVGRLARVLTHALNPPTKETSGSVPPEALTAFGDALASARTGVSGPRAWVDLVRRAGFAEEDEAYVVRLEPRMDFGTLEAAEPGVAAIRAAAEELHLTEKTGVRIRITGDPVLNLEEVESLEVQGILAGLGSFLLVGIALAVALRSIRVVAAVLANLAACLIATAGIAAWTVGSLNQISVAFAVLLIGLGVDFGIHLAMQFGDLRTREPGLGARRLLGRVGFGIGGSLCLCALTTAVGFLSFAPTDFRGVAELGIIAGTGMLVSMGYSVTLLPALLVWREPAPARAPRIPISIRRAIRALRQRPGLVCAGAGALAIVAVPFASRVAFDPNSATNLRDPDTESVQAFRDMLAQSRTSPWTIDIIEPSAEAAAALAGQLRDLPAVGEARTIADLVPTSIAAKQTALEDASLFLPRTRRRPLSFEAQRDSLHALHSALLSRADNDATKLVQEVDLLLRRASPQALLAASDQLSGGVGDWLERLRGMFAPEAFAIDDLPPSVRQEFLASDGSARIVLTPKRNVEQSEALTEFVESVAVVAPRATGPAVAMVAWAQLAIHSMEQALATALLTMAALLWIVWRRWSDVLLAVAPMGLAALYTAGVMGATGLDLNMANIIVVPLLLGIGADSGIHLIHRWRHEPNGTPLLETSAARAIVFSGLTTISSFASLGLASHLGMATLGRLLTLGLLMTLLAYVVVLPALLELLADTRESARAAPLVSR